MSNARVLELTNVSPWHGRKTSVVFEGRMPHGSGFRDIGVSVPIDELVIVAGLVEPALASGVNEIGHALWHYENPTRPFPCSTCSATVKERKDLVDDLEAMRAALVGTDVDALRQLAERTRNKRSIREDRDRETARADAARDALRDLFDAAHETVEGNRHRFITRRQCAGHTADGSAGYRLQCQGCFEWASGDGEETIAHADDCDYKASKDALARARAVIAR